MYFLMVYLSYGRFSSDPTKLLQPQIQPSPVRVVHYLWLCFEKEETSNSPDTSFCGEVLNLNLTMLSLMPKLVNA